MKDSLILSLGVSCDQTTLGGEVRQTGRVREPQVMAKGKNGTEGVAVCPGITMIYRALSGHSL